jgi:hypothetical protein
MDTGTRLGHLERIEENRMPKKIFIKELGRDVGEDPLKDEKRK